MLIVVFLPVLSQNSSTDTFICKDFQKKAVWNTSIQNMYSVYPFFDRIDTVLQFRNHSAADSTIGDQVLSLIYTKFGDQSGRIGSVSVYTFNIGKEGKFLCIDRLCNSAGCIICVNVVGIKILVKTDWEYDRKEVSFQKVRRIFGLTFVTSPT